MAILGILGGASSLSAGDAPWGQTVQAGLLVTSIPIHALIGTWLYRALLPTRFSRAFSVWVIQSSFLMVLGLFVFDLIHRLG